MSSDEWWLTFGENSTEEDIARAQLVRVRFECSLEVHLPMLIEWKVDQSMADTKD